jgi:hypothetical protein
LGARCAGKNPGRAPLCIHNCRPKPPPPKAMDGSMNLEQALEERLRIIDCKPSDIKAFIKVGAVVLLWSCFFSCVCIAMGAWFF